VRILILALAVWAALPGVARADDCASAHPMEHLTLLFADERWDDVHYVTQTLETLCPEAPERWRWQLLDGLVLFRLEEHARSRDLFVDVARSPEPTAAAPATVLLAWSYLRDQDEQAFSLSLQRVPAAARPRLLTLWAVRDPEQFEHHVATLDLELGQRARVLHARYRSARPKRPWLAGTLSGLVPGLGQAYAGSWESAAIAFVLNGVFIGATVELARHDLYFSASTTGLAASVFYLGNIFNAADLARRRNEVAAQAEYDHLERLLVPEAWAEGF
jgi:hypothetical protein